MDKMEKSLECVSCFHYENCVADGICGGYINTYEMELDDMDDVIEEGRYGFRAEWFSYDELFYN